MLSLCDDSVKVYFIMPMKISEETVTCIVYNIEHEQGKIFQVSIPQSSFDQF